VPTTSGPRSAPDRHRSPTPVPSVARVIVEVEPYHLDRPFDYAIREDLAGDARVGSRVEVVFGGRKRRGVVAELADASEVPESRLQPLRRVLGGYAWMRPEDLDLARWAGERFAAPVADVVRHALPNRTVDVERRAEAAGWFPPGAAQRPTSDPAPAEAVLEEGWGPYGDRGRALLAAAHGGTGSFYWRPLPGEDVGARLAELVQLTLAGDRDVLVVVPDPASPVADAVVAAAADLAVDVRGGPSPRRVHGMWLRARCGHARVVVGERGVSLWPLERLGLAVVVDEANPALKERRSPRHHAREVVLERARRAGAVGLLVGMVPSAPAWRLLADRRVEPVTAPRDLERDRAPVVRVETGEGQVRTRLAKAGTDAIRRAVARGEYGVVLAARRGEGRALVCGTCGHRLRCPVCDSSLSRRTGRDPRVHCTACGWTSPGRARCAECGGERFVPLAAGAEQLGTELARTFADVPVAVLEGYAQPAPPPPAVLVMTRGSVLDAPPGPVGAVLLPDVDGQLRRPALDAAEDTLRLSMQLAAWTVAGRHDAGRGVRATDRERTALVVVQTREPEHPAVQALVRWDPGGFWRTEAAVRAELRFPPAATAIRLDVAGTGVEVAAELRRAVPVGDDVLGPLPGGERSTVLLRSGDRGATLAALAPLRREWSRAGLDVRVDVDPVDVG
jgi:primosomal protein N' (replication factor Y)